MDDDDGGRERREETRRVNERFFLAVSLAIFTGICKRTRGVLLRIRAQQDGRSVFYGGDYQNRFIVAWTQFCAGGDAYTTRRVGHQTYGGFYLPTDFALLLCLSPVVRRPMSLSSPESFSAFDLERRRFSEIHR